MRQTFRVMGTVASLDIPACDDRSVFESVFERLSQIDEDYSPFKTSSMVSRFNRSELNKPTSEFKRVMKACQEWQRTTNGYFSAGYKSDYEPSGYVKCWAIEQAAKVLKKAGHKTFCIGIGGDVLAEGKSWRIGISDPGDTKKIVANLEITNQGVATSGNYERGEHIFNPKTGLASDFWRSVTVINQDIIKADVWATAAFAMGKEASIELDGHSLDFLLIDKNDRLFMSEGVKKMASYS